MVDFNKLAQRAKQVIDQRGGPKSVAEDAKELRDIAGHRGESTTDKLKEAAEALRQPGAAPRDPASSGDDGGSRHKTPGA